MKNNVENINAVFRTFIALELPEIIQNRLAENIKALKQKNLTWIRWSRPENIHLTLKFLGDVPAARIPNITNVIEALTDNFPPIKIVVGGLGAFPNINRPRVLWTGVQADEGLGKLQRDIENQLNSIGFSMEDRPFSPHLTLGRLMDSATSDQVFITSKSVEDIQMLDTINIFLDTICTYRSTLKPGGPVYSILHTVKLKLKQ